MIRRGFRTAAPAAAVVTTLSLWATYTHGTLLLNFKPVPLSADPELAFMGVGPLAPALRDAAGSHGNGDGNLPLNQQTAPGLLVDTPLTIPGSIDGKVPNPNATTSFRDVTLSLTGLEQSGPAYPAGAMLGQLLQSGTFTLMSTSGPAGTPQTLLLTGTIDNALVLTNLQGSGLVLSADVHYTGGVIYNAAAATLGIKNMPPIAGELSWTLLNMIATPPHASPGTYMPEFTADVNGQFSYVPEPSVLWMFALSAAGLLRRRRRCA